MYSKYGKPCKQKYDWRSLGSLLWHKVYLPWGQAQHFVLFQGTHTQFWDYNTLMNVSLNICGNTEWGMHIIFWTTNHQISRGDSAHLSFSSWLPVAESLLPSASPLQHFLLPIPHCWKDAVIIRSMRSLGSCRNSSIKRTNCYKDKMRFPCVKSKQNWTNTQMNKSG